MMSKYLLGLVLLAWSSGCWAVDEVKSDAGQRAVKLVFNDQSVSISVDSLKDFSLLNGMVSDEFVAEEDAIDLNLSPIKSVVFNYLVSYLQAPEAAIDKLQTSSADDLIQYLKDFLFLGMDFTAGAGKAWYQALCQALRTKLNPVVLEQVAGLYPYLSKLEVEEDLINVPQANGWSQSGRYLMEQVRLDGQLYQVSLSGQLIKLGEKTLGGSSISWGPGDYLIVKSFQAYDASSSGGNVRLGRATDHGLALVGDAVSGVHSATWRPHSSEVLIQFVNGQAGLYQVTEQGLQLKHQIDSCYGVEFSPTGQQVLIYSAGRWRLYQIKDDTLIELKSDLDGNSNLRFGWSPSGNWLFSDPGRQGWLYQFSSESGLIKVGEQVYGLSNFSWSPTEDLLYLNKQGAHHHYGLFIPTETGLVLKDLLLPGIKIARWSPNGKFIILFSWGDSGRLYRIDADSVRLIQEWKDVHEVYWSPDSEQVIIGDSDKGTRYQVDAQTNRLVPIEELPKFDGPIGWSPNGDRYWMKEYASGKVISRYVGDFKIYLKEELFLDFLDQERLAGRSVTLTEGSKVLALFNTLPEKLRHRLVANGYVVLSEVATSGGASGGPGLDFEGDIEMGKGL